MLQASVVADQNAKLSIFATRPAIYAPLYNFITEMMGTVALILLALLIELQVMGKGVSLGFSYSPCYC
jgi:glycerol uptake facilitator-like aquaporin